MHIWDSLQASFRGFTKAFLHSPQLFGLLGGGGMAVCDLSDFESGLPGLSCCWALEYHT